VLTKPQLTQEGEIRDERRIRSETRDKERLSGKGMFGGIGEEVLGKLHT